MPKLVVCAAIGMAARVSNDPSASSIPPASRLPPRRPSLLQLEGDEGEEEEEEDDYSEDFNNVPDAFAEFADDRLFSEE
jgi:hypothetical protein